MKSNVLKKQAALWTMLITLVTSGIAYAQNGVDLNKSPEVVNSSEGAMSSVPKEQQRIALGYVNQPPMVPHAVDKYEVTKNNNTCLKCHSVQNSRVTGAPRISATHFTGRDGHVDSDLAPRRFFCLACHVPQANAAPIVDNTFKPAPGYGG